MLGLFHDLRSRPRFQNADFVSQLNQEQKTHNLERSCSAAIFVLPAICSISVVTQFNQKKHLLWVYTTEDAAAVGAIKFRLVLGNHRTSSRKLLAKPD